MIQRASDDDSKEMKSNRLKVLDSITLLLSLLPLALLFISVYAPWYTYEYSYPSHDNSSLVIVQGKEYFKGLEENSYNDGKISHLEVRWEQTNRSHLETLYITIFVLVIFAFLWDFFLIMISLLLISTRLCSDRWMLTLR